MGTGWPSSTASYAGDRLRSGSAHATALIVPGRDTIVPARRSAPLRDVIPNLVLDRTIEAGHNDLYDRKAFVETVREALARITGLHPETRPGAGSRL